MNVILYAESKKHAHKSIRVLQYYMSSNARVHKSPITHPSLLKRALLHVKRALLHVKRALLHVKRALSHVKRALLHVKRALLPLTLPHNEYAYSAAEYRLFYRAISQKRPIILRSLRIVATPYTRRVSGM